MNFKTKIFHIWLLTLLWALTAHADGAVGTLISGNNGGVQVPVTVDGTGALSVTGSFSATNPSVSTTGAASPASATLIGGDDTGTLRKIKVDSTGAVAITGTISASNPSVSANGSAIPASSTLLGGSDSGTMRALKVSSAGVVSIDGSAVTQPVSAASLPLPAGAATSALQGTGNTSLSSIDTKTPALVTGRVPVDGSGVTQPVSAASLPLPSGASTAAKQPALGTAGTASADVITVQGIASMTALKVDGSAVSQPVVQAGMDSVFLFRNDYSSVNVTTGAYVQVVASTSAQVNSLLIFDSSGSLLVLAVGGAGSEVDQVYIQPGGPASPINLKIPNGSRVSIKAVDANATSGQITITALH